MRKIFLFFIFLFLIINVNSVIAIGFSPGLLSFELDVNQRGCSNITINSNSPTILILDTWAENKTMAWDSRSFKKTSNYHGLSLDYPKKIDSKDKRFEVCISGKYSGEYHGSIILEEEQVGNTIMQGGVWLNVTIKGTNYKPENIEETSQIINESFVEKKTSNNQITGALVSVPENKVGVISIWVIIGLIIAIIFMIIIAFKIYQKKRRNNY